MENRHQHHTDDPAKGVAEDSRRAPGLYIHVPFCAAKCPYCTFFSVTDLSAVPVWLAALRHEMALCAGEFDCFDTLYLGGGTPSVLAPGELAVIIDTLYATFSVHENCEATIEINPGDLDENMLSFLRDSPLNRINVGIQSFNDDVLRSLGRRHDATAGRLSIDLLRTAGFGNLGIDLIYGVPGQSGESWSNTLEEALRHEPEHLSCYELTLEQGTSPGGQHHARGNESMPGEDDRYTLFMATSEGCEKAGYVHYEVSNFARHETLRSRHNRKYWNHTPYLGLGPSAHSFSGNRRWWNHSSLGRYCRDLQQNRRPVEEQETLSEEDLRMERIFLGLRTHEGISENDLTPGNSHAQDVLERSLSEGLFERRRNRIVPTPRGLALADRLALLL